MQMLACDICLFKQRAAYQLRIGDWSSDVCSSDLGGVTGGDVAEVAEGGVYDVVAGLGRAAVHRVAAGIRIVDDDGVCAGADRQGVARGNLMEIGRASGRERGCQPG